MWIPRDCWCVYEHRVGGRVIYIGSGVQHRAFTQDGRNELWHAVVAAAGGFDVRILDWFDVEAEARAYEAAAISLEQPECNINMRNNDLDVMVARKVPGIARRLEVRRAWWRKKDGRN